MAMHGDGSGIAARTVPPSTAGACTWESGFRGSDTPAGGSSGRSTGSISSSHVSGMTSPMVEGKTGTQWAGGACMGVQSPAADRGGCMPATAPAVSAGPGIPVLGMHVSGIMPEEGGCPSGDAATPAALPAPRAGPDSSDRRAANACDRGAPPAPPACCCGTCAAVGLRRGSTDSAHTVPEGRP